MTDSQFDQPIVSDGIVVHKPPAGETMKEIVAKAIEIVIFGVIVAAASVWMNHETAKKLEGLKAQQSRYLEELKAQQAKYLEEFKAKLALSTSIQQSKTARYRRDLEQFWYPLEAALAFDNSVWKIWHSFKYGDKRKHGYPREPKLAGAIEKLVLIPSHDRALAVFQAGFPTEIDDKFVKAAHEYVAHVTVFKGLRSIRDRRDPAAVHAAYPENYPGQLLESVRTAEKRLADEIRAELQ